MTASSFTSQPEPAILAAGPQNHSNTASAPLSGPVLITGALGFIGFHVTQALLEQGLRVIALDNLDPFYEVTVKQAHLQQLQQHAGFTFHRVDITHPTALNEMMAPYQDAFRHQGLILHLAAKAGVRPSIQDPAGYLETNVMGTQHLLELARRVDIPSFVFASSSSVYGSAPERVPFSEDQPVGCPVSPYAASKAMAEQLIHCYYSLYGISSVLLRFFTVYGPDQRPDLAIHKFTRLILEGKPIPFYGEGNTARDYTYIEDIVAGVLSACRFAQVQARQRTPCYEIINLGGNRTTTLSRMIELIEAATGRSAVLDKQPAQKGDVPVTFANIDKARRLLDYEPNTPIEQGIEKFVIWMTSEKERYNEGALSRF